MACCAVPPLQPGATPTTALQVTIASRNPNNRVGDSYDRLGIYASSKYQANGDVDDWSPVLTRPIVPRAPLLADALFVFADVLGKDVANGYLIMEIKIDGRVRWKVGSWISGHYHNFLTGPAFFISSGGKGVVRANGLKFQTATYTAASRCKPPYALFWYALLR